MLKNLLQTFFSSKNLKIFFKEYFNTVLTIVSVIIAVIALNNDEIVEKLVIGNDHIIQLNESTKNEIAELKMMTIELKKHTDSLSKQNQILRDDNVLLQNEVKIASAHFAIIKTQNESSNTIDKDKFMQAVLALNDLSIRPYSETATGGKAIYLQTKFYQILNDELANPFLAKNEKVYKKWRICYDNLVKNLKLINDCNKNATTLSQNCEETYIKNYYPKILNDYQLLIKFLNSQYPKYQLLRK
jgi:hypothetical protein